MPLLPASLDRVQIPPPPPSLHTCFHTVVSGFHVLLATPSSGRVPTFSPTFSSYFRRVAGMQRDRHGVEVVVEQVGVSVEGDLRGSVPKHALERIAI
jgi:hypothetical protein